MSFFHPILCRFENSLGCSAYILGHEPSFPLFGVFGYTGVSIPSIRATYIRFQSFFSTAYIIPLQSLHLHVTIMKYPLLTFVLAAIVMASSTPMEQSLDKRGSPMTMTIYSGSDCVADGAAPSPGFWAINMIYGHQYAKVIRSYKLSRNLSSTEQLDFSIAGPQGGQSIDKKAFGNVASSCSFYSYSAYASTTGEGPGNGRDEGCYTIESPHMYEQCVTLKTAKCPFRLPGCGGETESDATNGQYILPTGGLTTDGSSQGVYIHG